MKPSHLVITLLVVGVLAACQTVPDAVDSSTQDASATAGGEGFEGQLAIIGTDGNLYRYDSPSGAEAVTHDAAIADGFFYRDPSWSPDGWLSYVGVAHSGSDVEIGVNAIPPGGGDPVQLESGPDDYIYGYWSPATCVQREACARFAYLMQDAGQIGMRIATLGDNLDALTISRLGRASTFYYSWSPDGRAMLWFTGGTDLSIYDALEDQVTETLEVMPGTFQTPIWSPIDDRLLYATAQNRLTQMAIREGASEQPFGDAVDDRLAFTWSPDGARVAYAHGISDFQALTIHNLETGVEQRYETLEKVLAWFWSPDGTKLAVINIEMTRPELQQAASGRHARPLNQETGHPVLGWYLIDVKEGSLQRVIEFVATFDQTYFYQWFEQFAQSHQIWSPDSRYLVYAERRLDDKPRVRIIDTENLTRAPETLMEGTLAIFSFG